MRRGHGVMGAVVVGLGLTFGSPGGTPSKPVAETGSVHGTVAVARPATGEGPRFRLYTRFGPGQHPAPRGAAPLPEESVIVFLQSVSGAWGADSAPERTHVIEQIDEDFVPHVVPVLRGSTVEFSNMDPYFHNVFSLSGAKSFDLGRYPRGTSKSVRFEQPGIVQVFCHIHSDMSALVLVLDNPFFTVAAPDGQFRIDGIPPGDYRIVAWHERSDPVFKQVRVSAGGNTELDFAIPTIADATQRD